MKFHCPGCRIVFSVPDDKVPEGKGVKILCPKCRTPVDRKDTADPVLALDEEKAEEKPRSSTPPVHREEDQEDSSLEVFEEGVKTALLYLSHQSRSEKLSQVLRQLDYYVSVAARAKTAINRLHQNRYDLVVIDEKLDDQKNAEHLVLHHVKLLPMHTRRQFFVCLLSEDLPTLDRLTAFRLGVDMILNIKELDSAKVLLVRAMKEHRSFYKVFTSELERKG